MIDELNEKIDAAISKMADQVKAQPDAQRSLHCSQAALNLAHAKSILKSMSSTNQAAEAATGSSTKKS